VLSSRLCLLTRYVERNTSHDKLLTDTDQVIDDGTLEEAFIRDVLGGDEEHIDEAGNTDQPSKLSDAEYGLFRLKRLGNWNEQLRKQNTMMELEPAVLAGLHAMLVAVEPMQASTTTHPTIVDGKWISYGDKKLDKVWLDVVEATRIAFEREGLPFEETDMVKWSGVLDARLWLGWNYAPAGAKYKGQFRTTIDPNNGCIIWVCFKLGLDRFEIETISEILMSERWFYREMVPPRKKCKKGGKGKKAKKDEIENKQPDQPYDTRPADIRELHEDQMYEVNEAASTVLDIEMGKRNVEKFIERYEENDDYVFVKIFDKRIFTTTKYDGCIVKGTDGKIKKLVLFVYHPEGSMFSDNTELTEDCDAQWNLIADVFHLRNGDRHLLQRAAEKKAPGPGMTKSEWELRWQGIRTAIEMIMWERKFNRVIDRENIPHQMTKTENDNARKVLFKYNPLGQSYTKQWLTNVQSEGRATQEANGWEALRRGNATQAAGGYEALRRGTETQATGGFEALGRGHETQSANWRDGLTIILQDSNHKEAQRWASEFDAKYKTVGRVSGLYDGVEIGLMARHAIFDKKCVTQAGLARILQVGTERGEKDSSALKAKLRTGVWIAKNLGTSF